MLTELPEAQARGEIAAIFAEIRQLYATPYVSSIHRHLATRPGVLEWAWGSVAPAFRSGRAQEMAWTAAQQVSLPALDAIPREALRVWGVGDGDVATIKAIAQSFTRVAPVNLVFGGLIADVLLEGGARDSNGQGAVAGEGAWIAPPLLPPPPAMLDAGRLGAGEAALLACFRSGQGETAFVPGLYRMLAHWPGLLAHLAVVLKPHFNGAGKTEAAQKILAGSRNIVGELKDRVVAVPGLPAPDAAEARHLRDMIDGYRVTSPEMILFGRLIDEAIA